MPTLPIIHGRQETDAGTVRRYERICSRGHGAVMSAALPEPGTVLLIRE